MSERAVWLLKQVWLGRLDCAECSCVVPCRALQHVGVTGTLERDFDAEEIMHCPRCDAPWPDHDGFGVLACEACGYCSHPGFDLHDDGRWHCTICGAVRRE